MVRASGDAIPFDDPWWKVLAALVALLASLGALLEAKAGHGSATIGLSGYQHDKPTEYKWCIPDPKVPGGSNAYTPAGMLSALASAALLAAMEDVIDPWERGRVAAKLQTGEFPRTESVKVDFQYPNVMAAGTRYEVGVRWTYDAELSSGRTATLKADEVHPSSHLVKWAINAPQQAHIGQPTIVKIRGTKPDGVAFKADELYGFAIFLAPDGNNFRVPLLDDGRSHDEVANDGWYTASILIEDLMAQAHLNRTASGKFNLLCRT